MKKVETALSRLPDLLDSQMETTLLRSCLSLPKVAFALSTCPPEYIANASKAFDSAIRASLSDITGCPLLDWSWEKATLLSSLRGLNLHLTSFHAQAAFIGSLVRCQDLISSVLGQTPIENSHLQSIFLALVHNAARPNWHSLEDIDIPLTQKALSHAIDEATFDHLLASAADTRTKALVLSTTIPHAGDWLNVFPSQALGLHFLDW